MPDTRFKIQLGDTNAYMYRSFKDDKPKRRKFMMCCDGCGCERRRSPETTGFSELPPHALALYTDPSDVDKSWSILLLSEKQHEMRAEHKTSIYMHDRVSKTLMFKSRVAAFGSKARSDDEDALRDKAVRNVLQLCIANGQPAESVVRLADGRRFVVASIPVWDDQDVLAGSLWTARMVATEDGETLPPLAARKRAALYYDAGSGSFVLNESWMRQRDLLSGTFTGKDGENAVLLVSADGHIDMAKNLDKAGELVVDPSPAFPCELNIILNERVAAQLHEAFAHLRKTRHQGRVLTGFTLGKHGYSVVVTKMVNSTQGLDGFVITIHEEESLGMFVGSLRPEHDSPTQ